LRHVIVVKEQIRTAVDNDQKKSVLEIPAVEKVSDICANNQKKGILMISIMRGF